MGAIEEPRFAIGGENRGRDHGEEHDEGSLEHIVGNSAMRANLKRIRVFGWDASFERRKSEICSCPAIKDEMIDAQPSCEHESFKSSKPSALAARAVSLIAKSLI